MQALVDCVPTDRIALDMHDPELDPNKPCSERAVGGGYYAPAFKAIGATSCPLAGLALRL